MSVVGGTKNNPGAGDPPPPPPGRAAAVPAADLNVSDQAVGELQEGHGGGCGEAVGAPLQALVDAAVLLVLLDRHPHQVPDPLDCGPTHTEREWNVTSTERHPDQVPDPLDCGPTHTESGSGTSRQGDTL